MKKQNFVPSLIANDVNFEEVAKIICEAEKNLCRIFDDPQKVKEYLSHILSVQGEEQSNIMKQTDAWKMFNCLAISFPNLLSNGNIIGAFAELLVATALKGKLTNKNQSGFDVLVEEKYRIQVKATRKQNLNCLTGTTSDLHNLDKADLLVGIIFDERGEVLSATITPQNKIVNRLNFNASRHNISWSTLSKHRIVKYEGIDITKLIQIALQIISIVLQIVK